MGVEKIKAFSIIGRVDSLDTVTLVLGKSGVFQPDDVKSFYSNTRGFTRVSSGNPYSEPVTRISSAMTALGITPKYVRTKKNFKPTFEEIDAYSKMLLSKIDGYTKKRGDIQRRYNECKRGIEETSHFVSLDRNLEELLDMEYVKAVFGRIPKENVKKLGTDAYKSDFIEFVPCSQEDNYIWGVYFVPKTESDKAERIFSRLYFEESRFGEMDEAPSKWYKSLQGEFEKLEKSLEQIDEKLDSYTAENSGKILKYYTKAAEYNLYFTIKTRAMEKDGSFCLTGWVPESDAEKLKRKLEKIESVEVNVSGGNEELKLSPPVKLKNCFLTRPFEFYTQMYGVPRYREIDPTSFVAFTYVLLFGIMFGDVGHGFIVVLAGLLMWFIKHMPIGKILIPCGISGMVFGVIYGDVFGFEHAMDWFHIGILGLREKPIEVMSSKFTGTILMSAVGIGIALLLVAMCLNVYSSLRQRNVGRALFDTGGICGFLFYGMIAVGMFLMITFGVNLFTPLYVSAIVILFVVIFFREPLEKLVNGDKNWKPESWGGFITENIFESIEVLLSYVTNTMSFLRVAAFVLVHAGMMQVVFTLANTAGTVAYIPILVFGNGLVAALECLLVCIQVLRLEFYEMFSRFYSGEGRPYEPVRLSLVRN